MSDAVTVVAGTRHHRRRDDDDHGHDDDDEDDVKVRVLLSSARAAARGRRFRDAVEHYDAAFVRLVGRGDEVVAADVLNDSACALAEAGDDVAAHARLVECLRARNASLIARGEDRGARRRGRDDDDATTTVLAVARTLHNLGRCSSSTEEAFRAFSEAARLRTNCLGPRHPSVASSAAGAARARFSEGDHDDALGRWRRISSSSESRATDAVAARYNASRVHAARGDHSAAARELGAAPVAALPEHHPLVDLTWHALGEARRRAGHDLEGSLDCLRRALRLRRARFGNDGTHLSVVSTTLQIAVAQRCRREEAESTDAFRRAIRILATRLGPDHVMTSYAMKEYGDALVDFGRLAKAVSVYRTLVTSLRRARRKDDGDDDDALANALHDLGLLYRDVRNHSAALTVLAESYVLRKTKPSPPPSSSSFSPFSSSSSSRHSLSSTLRAMVDCRRSGPARYDEVARDARSDVDRPDAAADLYHALGDAHRVAGDHVPAVEAYGRALRIRRRRLGPEHPASTASEFRLGRALFRTGRADEALTTLRSCLESRRRRAADDDDDDDPAVARDAVATTARDVAEVLRYVNHRTTRTRTTSGTDRATGTDPSDDDDDDDDDDAATTGYSV